MNRDDVLRFAGEPLYWITHESQWRLADGGNRKGAVPVHNKRSSTAKIPLYTEAQLLAMYAKGADDMRERAADICDAMSTSKWDAYKGKNGDNTLRANPYVEGMADAASDLTESIRALPITPEGKQGE